jgi:hypothetical protein
MSKKKMCKYMACCCPPKCPKNCNPKTCEIIPAKSKTKSVRGWAFIGATTKEICISSVQPFCMSVPCIAHIKPSDYKKLKEFNK